MHLFKSPLPTSSDLEFGGGRAESADKVSKDPEAKGKYAKFWGQYGKAIKLGIIEDASNRVRLAKLLRVHT